MFSVLFLTVIVLGVVKLQTSNLALSSTQNHTLEATELANQSAEIVEAIRRSGITCPDLIINTPDTTLRSCIRYLHLENNVYSLRDEATATDTDKVINLTFTRKIRIYPVGIDGGSITNNLMDPSAANAFEAVAQIEWEDSTGTHSSSEAKRIIYR